MNNVAVAVKERPITFSPKMVEAIRTGLKTQTRRVLSPLPSSTEEPWPTVGSHVTLDDMLEDLAYYLDTGLCPFGKPGDLLWVREIWRTLEVYDSFSPTVLIEDVGADRLPIGYTGGEFIHWRRAAQPGRWRSPRHMPKALSRFFLEIKAIHLEKLQEIGHSDAVKEGVEWKPGTWTDAVNGFSSLWDSINTRHPWKSNPWVWVVEFSLVFRNGA